MRKCKTKDCVRQINEVYCSIECACYDGAFSVIRGWIVKDKFGKEFQVGDFILYPVSRRSSVYMKVARVEKINPDSLTVLSIEDIWGNIQTANKSTVRTIDKIVIINEGMLSAPYREAFEKHDYVE